MFKYEDICEYKKPYIIAEIGSTIMAIWNWQRR